MNTRPVEHRRKKHLTVAVIHFVLFLFALSGCAVVPLPLLRKMLERHRRESF